MMTKRIAALTLVLALLAGCAAQALAESEDPILLTVNGTALRLSDAQPVYDYYVELYGGDGYDMEDEANLEVIRAFTTKQLIWSTLIARYAAENGLDVFTAEEEAQMAADNDAMWEDAIAEYIAYYTGVEDASALPEDEAATLRANAVAYYEAGGFTRESTLADQRESYVSERVKAAVLEGEDIDITEEDIAAYHASLAEQDRALLYDDENGYGMSPSEIFAMYNYFGYELYYIPAGFRMVKHILLNPDGEALDAFLALAARWEEQADALETGEGGEPAVTYEQVEAARLAVIDSVRGELDAIDAALESGVSFDDLIAQYGQDPGAAEEPVKSEGYRVSPDSSEYDADFLAGAFSTDQPGDISDPVVTAFGVHLILYANDVPEGPVAMTEAMHDEYLEYLTKEAEDQAFDAVLEHWIAESDIVFTAEGEAWKTDILDNTQAE